MTHDTDQHDGVETGAGLEGVRVAITGGTSGLGLALVRRLTGLGADVAFVARTADRVRRVAAETGAVGIVGDVGDKDAVYPIALQVTGAFGDLDVLINNASTLGPSPLALLADTDCEDLESALTVNLVGPFRLTKALFGALPASARPGGPATVVNTSSDAAETPYPTWGAYGASKAALRHLTAIWDEETGADGIRLLAIDPGDMNTPLHAEADPDADPTTLKRPERSATEIITEIFDGEGHGRAGRREAGGGRREAGGGRREAGGMIAADGPGGPDRRLMIIDGDGHILELSRDALARWFEPGDLVVTNDAATLPASLHGHHEPSGDPLEIGLAGFTDIDDPSRFIAVAFGPGDHRTLTEDRLPPPELSPGDRLALGPLAGVVVRLLDDPRLLELHFDGEPTEILAGMAEHGQPIQYAHVPQPLNDPVCPRTPTVEAVGRVDRSRRKAVGVRNPRRPGSRWTGGPCRPGGSEASTW